MAYSTSIANGYNANGDFVPPSTIAAQIVQIQHQGTVAKHNEQQALFNGLLQEILKNPTENVETNLEMNVQMVKVLVEAGLMSLANDQPFAPDILVKQAEDSVTVIETTIQRQAGVLMSPISPGGPPVCLWLFTKVVALVGRRSVEFALPQRLLRAITSTKIIQLTTMINEMIDDTLKGMSM